jgi:hypothetical protein
MAPRKKPGRKRKWVLSRWVQPISPLLAPTKQCEKEDKTKVMHVVILEQTNTDIKWCVIENPATSWQGRWEAAGRQLMITKRQALKEPLAKKSGRHCRKRDCPPCHG